MAAILLVVGYKLAKPALFKKIYKEGMGQFIPFIVTIAGIVFTDLLTGIALGLVVAVFIILRNNFKIPYKMNNDNLEDKGKITIMLSEDVSFLNKASVMKALSELPDNSEVHIDASKNHFIHHDVIEIIEDFKINAETRNIKVKITDLYNDQVEKPKIHYKVTTK